MKGLVGGPLLVGGLGPGPPGSSPLNPALTACDLENYVVLTMKRKSQAICAL